VPTYNGEYYSGYGQPSANVIAGMVAADKAAAAKKTATATTPAPSSGGGGGSVATKAPSATTSGVDYNFENNPNKYVSANGVTYASADVARQQGVSDFLSGAAPKPPTTVPPKIVYTGDQAANDLANKQLDLQAATNAMTQQQQQQQNQAAQQPAAPATVDDLERITRQENANAEINAIAKRQETAYQNFQDQLNQLRAGTFPLTPDQQAQVNATQSQFNALKAQQEIANKNYEAGVTLAGIAAGRNRFAPEISLGEIQNAVSAGLQKVADLDIKAALAISDLRAGFQSQNFELINSAYTAASNYFAQKTDTIFKMAENVRQETALALEQHKQAIAEQQAELEREDAARKFASENSITKPFYLVGNTAINTLTGEAVDLPTYQRLTGQQVGLPEEQTDFSKIQKIDLPERAQVASIMDKYPDAGVTLNDSLATATAKLKGSSIYRKETYIAPSSYSSLTGGVSTVGGNDIVAGVKVPAGIAGDVEDVLSGRNTLYNIRQTMGRTNAAAAYMDAMRKAIRSIDPNFDFVASDAGGKFVSSTYYQRSVAAIDSVLPNIDKIVELSNQVGRIGIRGVDDILQKGGVQIGNQKIANFREAQKLIADEIGLALGQGTVSDMKLQLGFDVTDPAVSPEVFASNMGIVREFIQNRKKGLEQQRYSSSVDLGGGSAGGTDFEINGVKYHLGSDGLYYKE
jgi:hypothetical protein